MKVVKSPHIYKNVIYSPYLMPAIILCIGFITFFTYDITVVPDLKNIYIPAATNIYHGRGYIQQGFPIFYRGPLFSLMITAGYILLGPSPWSAYWVIRIFAISNPLLLYFIGKKIYGKWVGFSAALLALTSYAVCQASYRHLDAIWPFFVLLSTYLIVNGFEKRKIYYYMLSGLFMGLAFLTKEAAILFFIIPLLSFLLIKDYRTKDGLKGTIIYFAVLIFTMLPWLLYLFFNSALSDILGKAGPKVVNEIVGRAPSGESKILILSRIAFYIDGMVKYYSNKFGNNFLLAPLFIIAWAYCLIRAFRRNKYSIIMILFLLLYSPLIFFLGRNQWRLGQGLMLFLISYIVIADFLWQIGFYISHILNRAGKIRIQSPHKNLFSALIITAVICSQIFIPNRNGENYITFLQRSFFYQVLFNNNATFIIGKKPASVDEEIRGWIMEELPAASKLLLVGIKAGRLLYPEDEVRVQLHKLSLVRLKRYNAPLEKFLDNNIILVETDYPRAYIEVLTEENLWKAIGENQIDYVLLYGNKCYLAYYMDMNSGLEKIKDFGVKTKVYRVHSKQIIDNFKTLVEKKLVLYLNWIKDKDNKKFIRYKDDFLKYIFGWDDERFNELLSLQKNSLSADFILVRRWYFNDLDKKTLLKK